MGTTETGVPRRRKPMLTLKGDHMNLIYKKADVSDIDLLTQTRVLVLRAVNELSEDTDMSIVEHESYQYYKECFNNYNEHVAYLISDNDIFVGTGGISFFKVMPTFRNPSGRKAYIMNMYTHSDYRRRGIAYHTLDLLVQESKSRGIDHISLEATDMGKPLYEKYGFRDIKGEMRLLLN